MRTHYEVLGLSEDASSATIRHTYLRLISIYHPDHNEDPQAHRVTAELIEAYSVLGNEEKRAEYDRTRHPSSGTSGARSAASSTTASSKSNSVQEIVCRQCGVQDSTLRLSVMTWVGSLILVTRRGGRYGLWCAKCRAKQAGIWSTVTGIFGWWGFPFGPIYTIPALYYNAIGGKQDRSANAQMLRLVGYQLYQKGCFAEARESLNSSLKLEKDLATEKFTSSIPHSQAASSLTKMVFAVLTAVPSVATTALFITLCVNYLNQPTGYAANYHPVVTTGAAPTADSSELVHKVSGASTNRSQVNSLANQLADAVQANATLAGTHQSGTTTIRDFQLDRSKYDATVFSTISAEIAPYLEDSGANADGFVSSADFNARMMRDSITILNEFTDGQDISDAVHQVEILGDDEHVRLWLRNSAYASAYASLLQMLNVLERNQVQGSTSISRRQEISSLKQKLGDLRKQLQYVRQTNDQSSEQEIVRAYNEAVEQHNAVLRTEKRERGLYYKADLAFNKCLDPSILMSKFQSVNLTSDEGSIASSPEAN